MIELLQNENSKNLITLSQTENTSALLFNKHDAHAIAAWRAIEANTEASKRRANQQTARNAQLNLPHEQSEVQVPCMINITCIETMAKRLWSTQYR